MTSKNVTDDKFIANYDADPTYAYSDFWQGRKYEHESEMYLLKKIFTELFKNKNPNTIIDLGGGHARLAPIYKNIFKKCILGDYSLNELQTGKNNLAKMNAKNFQLIALNAYKIPFQNNYFDAIVSVRLAHHIKDLKLLFTEIHRLLKPNGYLIIEIANKNHLKNIIKKIVKGKFKKLFNPEPIQVKHDQSSSQGIRTNQISIMYNYSSNYVLNKAMDCKLIPVSIYPCSWLRNTLLKKLFSTKLLLRLEKLLQKLTWLKITPSLFYVFKKANSTYNESADGLCSPLNKSKLKINLKQNLIQAGNKKYRIVNGIYDLREPRPEEINF